MEFSQFALVVGIAAGFGLIARLLKQPLLIGYLIAGLFLSLTGIGEGESLIALGQVGVALLLFLVGLEMNVSELPTVGKVALLTGIGQIIFTSTIGYIIAILLGFPPLSAIYIAVALTFSSTIIIVKLLSEKNDLNSLYGKISIGFLLVQDLVVVLILMFLGGLGKGETGLYSYLVVGIKGVLLLALVWVLSKKIIPGLFVRMLDSSTELMFIVCIAWALGMAAFVAGPLGFSLEIGGFLAGLALSNLPEHLQVASRTRPLRDFFLTIFFVVLGSELLVNEISTIIGPAIIFSLFVLVGNPIIVMVIMGLLGHRKKTSFSSSVTVAQISEFSFILMGSGAVLGHVTSQEVSMVIIVGVITMTTSTYLILGSDKLYKRIERFLNIFERKGKIVPLPQAHSTLRNHIVLVGGDRTGRALVPRLLRSKTDFVVIDFNPEVVLRLEHKGVPVVFGDVNDEDISHAVSLNKARLIISTTANMQDNLTILENIQNAKPRPQTIFKANTVTDALVLYHHGATYINVPEIVAGEHIRQLLFNYGDSRKKIAKLGKSHERRLKRVLM